MKYLILIITTLIIVSAGYFSFTEYKQYRREELAWRTHRLEMELKAVCQSASAVGGDSWGYKSCLDELKLNEPKIQQN
jgi:hypothetical protein